jgi:hypothetical protein
MTYEINYNSQFSSYEVRFDGKPSEEVRNALKAMRFRWHSVNKCWYGYNQSEESIAAAITSASTEEEPATVYGDGYLGGGSYYGSKSHKYLHGADLSAAIRADLKAAGIKGVTVKCHTYTGGQNITATIKTTAADYISRQQFIDSYRIKFSMYWIDCGNGESIHVDKYFALDGDEQERIRIAAAEREWNQNTTKEQDVRLSWVNWLTDAAMKKLKAIDSIIAAYRYDNSNGMVDYFDTNFYYDLRLKPVEA